MSSIGCALRTPFFTDHTRPAFSITSIRPPGRNATPVGGEVQVTPGTAS